MEPDKLESLKHRFLLQLNQPAGNVPRPKQKFVLVVGGAPGSGKTTVARMFAELSGGFHIQANSAREMLREHGHQAWGKNVHELVQTVAQDLLASDCSVIIDGMIMEEGERQLARDLAEKYGARAFFAAVTTNTEIATQRARRRYNDGKQSTFDDWRASPEKVEQYMADVTSRAKLLQKKLNDLALGWQGVRRIENDEAEKFLQKAVEAAWNDLTARLEIAGG